MVKRDLAGSPRVGVPAGFPPILETLEIVRAALDEEVRPFTVDRPQYVVRMACRLIEIALRELEDRSGSATELDARIRGIGATDESDLAAGLVAGRFDPTDESVREIVHDLVRWRLAIARPDHLAQAAPLS